MNPPDLSRIKHLDFSEFHPLDHSLLNCVGYPGGRRTHIRYFWEFKHNWRDLANRPLCLVGHHRWHKMWKGRPMVRVKDWCGSCGKRREPLDG